MKILIIDQDQDMLAAIAGLLSNKLHQDSLWKATTAREARFLWERQDPDLVIIDPVLPDDANSMELCQHLRGNETLILAMSQSLDARDEIAYLKAGADAYLRKPFLPAQLLAHVTALSRRHRKAFSMRKGKGIEVGTVHLDAAFLTVHVSGPEPKEAQLTPTEGKVLAILMAHADQICTRQFLIELAWGIDYEGECPPPLKSHIRHLRAKIGDDLIETVRHVGYRFVAPGAQNSEKQDRVAVVQ